MLGLLWRDLREGSWKKARSMVLRDGPEFKAGAVRFVNLCPVNAGVAIGPKRIMLKPGAVEIRNIGVVDGLPIAITYSLPQGGSRKIYSSAFVQNRGERATVVIYRADGKKPRSPVKVVMLRESVPAPLKVKKKDKAE